MTFAYGLVVDPKVETEGHDRVYRGGSWNGFCRSAYRYGLVRSDRVGRLGFRVLIEVRHVKG